MALYPSDGVFIMKQTIKRLFSVKKGFLSALLLPFIVINFIGILPISEPKIQSAEADSKINQIDFSALSMIQNNSLLPIPGKDSFVVKKTINVIITAYSSTVDQTDSTPFITASNTTVRDGIVANNLLPFGTRIRIPELYGDKIFVVEDRMNSRKSDYHFDIWFESTQEAKEFGARITKIEVLK